MQEIKVYFFSSKVQEKQLETQEWKKKYDKLHMEYKEMGYESVLIFFISTYLLELLFLTYVPHLLFFSTFFRKIVAEFESTITQMMGKFHIYTLRGLRGRGWWCILSLRLLAEGSTLSLLMAFQVLPG